MSEEILIRHCAPTLAGIKTGSIFSCTYVSKHGMIADLRRLNQKLVPKGLCVLPLRYAENRALIYVYRPAHLADDLADTEALNLLAEAGYKNKMSKKCVVELIQRLQLSDNFPHEIGLFLSYPPEDVRGFIENKGNACKCVGYWKVYGDPEKARKTFAKYKRCTESYYSQWARGVAVEDM